MILTLVVTIGVLYAVGVWLLLQRSLSRIVIGLAVLGHGANLLLLAAGGRAGDPPLAGADPATTADPLPQALALTAIVLASAVVIDGGYAYAQLKTPRSTDEDACGREEGDQSGGVLGPDFGVAYKLRPDLWLGVYLRYLHTFTKKVWTNEGGDLQHRFFHPLLATGVSLTTRADKLWVRSDAHRPGFLAALDRACQADDAALGSWGNGIPLPNPAGLDPDEITPAARNIHRVMAASATRCRQPASVKAATTSGKLKVSGPMSSGIRQTAASMGL